MVGVRAQRATVLHGGLHDRWTDYFLHHPPRAEDMCAVTRRRAIFAKNTMCYPRRSI